MSIINGARRLWTKNNGELRSVRVIKGANKGSYYVMVLDRLGQDIPDAKVQVASESQLSQAISLQDLTPTQLRIARDRNLNVLVFDNLPEGRILAGQIVSYSLEWVNVRYKSTTMNRKAHNVFLLPCPAAESLLSNMLMDVKSPVSVPADVAAAEQKALREYCIADLVATPETCSLEHAGLKRGFILWNPKSTHAPTVIYPSIQKARAVQAFMASKHPGEAFHICAVGPGLIVETVTTTTEKHV